jgi:hypothetical protein
MGTERFYKPGSFYRICDRTGMAVRAERTRKEWNNLIVSDRVWEARQPQDFVKGVDDNQTVPNARPRQPNVYIGEANVAEFEVYHSGKFLVQNGQIRVYDVIASPVNAANFPSGF